jgi:hypothetical protein
MNSRNDRAVATSFFRKLKKHAVGRLAGRSLFVLSSNP